MLKTLSLRRHLGIWFLLQIYVKGATEKIILCVIEACVETNEKKTNDVRPSPYLCCISYRNMKYAYWEIRV